MYGYTPSYANSLSNGFLSLYSSTVFAANLILDNVREQSSSKVPQEECLGLAPAVRRSFSRDEIRWERDNTVWMRQSWVLPTTVTRRKK